MLRVRHVAQTLEPDPVNTGVGSRDFRAGCRMRPRAPLPVLEGVEMNRSHTTRYRTVDLLVTVVIGVAFGVAFLGYGQLYTLIGPLTTAFKPAEGLLAGIWFLPAVLVIEVLPEAFWMLELISTLPLESMSMSPVS